MHATGKMRFYQILSSASNLLTLPLAYVFLLMNDVPEYTYIALFITMGTNLLAGLISAHKFADISDEGIISLNNKNIGFVDDDGSIIINNREVGYIDADNNFVFYKTFANI